MSIENAVWITEKDGFESPIFRKKFSASHIRKAVISICGLGWFELYVNGQPASDAVLGPAVSVYDDIAGRRLLYPLSDHVTHTRIYYCEYEVTSLIRNGENLLSVQLGNGWYNQHRRTIEGDFAVETPRLAFSLVLSDDEGNTTELLSDETVLAGKSQIIENNLFYGEKHDLSKLCDFHGMDFDDSYFSDAYVCDRPKGELTLYEFPKERVIRTIVPEFLGIYAGKKLYDLGENITGWLTFNTVSGYEGNIILEHAEERRKDGTLDFSYSGGAGQIQSFEVLCDGRVHKGVHPHFSWQAFRYFTLEGDAEDIRCEVVHTDVLQTGTFICQDERINRLLELYIRTQLNNIHGCVPMDCPHRERLGYTGDGQIVCETAMYVFDMRGVYEKWMRDITDCQNSENGHIQHTAPFYGGGGGPSGWGGAVIVVPYIYYRMCGDGKLVREHLTAMTKYLSYMEQHCEHGLVTHEEKDGWCLGDWCYKGCTPHSDDPLTPEFVNTVYLVKFYDIMLQLETELGINIHSESYQAYRIAHIGAIIEKYYDAKTGDFCQGAFAANAFAMDIGLGDERTLANLVKKYEELEGFDTGIFGTEILMRILCENGYAELAYRLLISEKEGHSFGHMMANGATTLWETWEGEQSHNHPMFGGCIKTLWTAFLGIQSLEAGYRKVMIQPCDIPELGNMEGYVATPNGRITVSLRRDGKIVWITVDLPEGIEAYCSYQGSLKELHSGENHMEFVSDSGNW